MNTSLRLLILASTLGAAALLGTTAARGQTVITSLPYTISTKGLYVLNSDLSSAQTTGTLITVNASNVTIDFQGHYIAGAVGNTGQNTTGISAIEQSNLTIKNGTIAYCRYGIFIQGNGSSSTNAVDELIDSMRVTYCYFVAVEVMYCPGSRVQNCQITQTGYSGANSAFGIIGSGSGSTIQNNTISTVSANFGYGISAAESFARENTVSSAYYGVYGGKYQNNLTLSCTYPYSAGLDAGGNN